jgi:hypothetical protein
MDLGTRTSTTVLPCQGSTGPVMQIDYTLSWGLDLSHSHGHRLTESLLLRGMACILPIKRG